MSLVLVRLGWWDLLTGLPVITDHPPLSFLLFKAWSLAFHSEWSMRLLPVLLGVCAVGGLMRVAGGIHPRAAVPTGLLAAVSPIPVHYSQELRGYSLLFLLSVLSLLAAQRLAWRGPSRGRLAFLAVVSAAAAHTHAVGLFVFLMACVFLVAMRGRAELKALLRPSGAWLWLLLVSPMLWFNLYWAAVHQQTWWIPEHSWSRMQSYAQEFFGIMLVRHWEDRQTPRPVWTAYVLQRLLIIGPAVLVMAALGCRRLRRPLLALALAAGSYVGALALVGAVSIPNMLPRTLLPAWAPVLVLLGLGGAGRLGRGGRVLPRAVLGLLVCLYGMSWLWYVHAGPPRRPPTRALYGRILTQLGPHDVVVSAYNCEDVTAYYLGGVVPGERLISKRGSRFSGLPARLQVTPLKPDRHWQDRLRATLETAAEASGGRYNVWLIEYPLEVDPWPPVFSEVLSKQHRLAEEFVNEDVTMPRAARYVPRPMAEHEF